MRTKKILLGLLFSLLFSIRGNAYDFEAGGIYYNIISQSNLEVEVTYKELEKIYYDVYYSSYGYTNTSEYKGNIIIPETVNYNNKTYEVTGIGECAFGTRPTYKVYSGDRPMSYACPVSAVEIPNSVKYIDERAFYLCNELYRVDFPDELEIISDYAFSQCTFLLSASLENTKLKSIGSYSFEGAKIISSLVLPSSTESIGSKAFIDCISLRTVICKTSNCNILSDAFKNCTNLQEVFYTGLNAPRNKISGSNPNMESYVPSSRIYGFGKDYVTFSKDSFEYNGAIHLVEGFNNIKYLTCEIEQPIETEVNVGDYTKYVMVKYSGDVELSLDVPFFYSITPAPLILTVTNAERVYGDPNPEFACSATGFVPGENLSNIGTTPTYYCEATQLSNAGTYKILAELDAKNYNITYKYGTLTVTKAPITASVINSSKIYGDSNPSFQLSFTGLRNNEVSPSWTAKPKFTTFADSKTAVGEYEVTAEGGESLNYIVTRYSPGVLSILKRDLKVKANNAERLYGEENPLFQISFSGFVNSDSQNDLLTQPEAYCNATIVSNAGEYPILVEGGSAENYSMVYERGTLFINPLTVGFKNIYNMVTFDDMSVSSNERYFNYLPEIEGPFSENDFYIDLWFIDGDNKYSNHVYTETSGSYKGNYVNTNYDRPMQAGKYIFNLTSKGTNPNVVANPSRCYLTVETNSTNLAWNDASPINVKVGETVELDISYLAYIYCQFYIDYDEELVTLNANNQMSNNSQWFVTGLKEGETTVSLSISCLKNDMGFYDFYDSKTVSNRIKVLPADPNSNAVEEIENERINIRVINNMIYIEKPADIITYVYDMSGKLIIKTSNSQIENLQRGIYIVRSGNQYKKIII